MVSKAFRILRQENFRKLSLPGIFTSIIRNFDFVGWLKVYHRKLIKKFGSTSNLLEAPEKTLENYLIKFESKLAATSREKA